jgi:cytochrome c oxidase assembly protein Cox11
MLFIHNPRMRPIIRLLVIGAVIFLITRPYNLFCNAFNKCSPIYFSDIVDYLPNNYPDYKASILIDTENSIPDLQFEAVEAVKYITINGRTNEFEFLMKNKTDKPISFFLELKIEPVDLEKHISKRKCLCGSRFTLAPKEERIVKAKLKIDKKIAGDSKFNKDEGLRILYKVKGY